jgi:hypothetical protein
MGMRTYWAGVTGRNTTGGSYQSGGTSSFPTTGFPSSAYLGNNRRYVGGGVQGQPSPMAGGAGTATAFDPRHQLVFLVVIIALGVWLWYKDNK